MTCLAALVADVQGSVLVRSFLIAIVLMAPVWVLVRRRVVRSHAPEPETVREPDPDETPRLEDVIADVARLATEARNEGSVTLTVPAELTVDGRPADPAVVDALVRDSLRRSGLAAVAEVDTPAGRTLELRPRTPDRSRPT